MRTIDTITLPSHARARRPAGLTLPTEAPIESRRGRSLVVLPDDRVLDAQGGDEDGVLHVRAAGTLASERVIAGVAPPIAVDPAGRRLLCGREAGWSRPVAGQSQRWRGADLRLLDLEGAELDRYPLQAPALWVDEGRFIARSMGFYHGRRALEPELAARHPGIADLFTDAEADGVASICVSSGTGDALIRCGVYQRWSRLAFLARRGDVLLYGGFLEVGAVRLPGWEPLWAATMGSGGLAYQMRALALSPDGSLVAVGAGGQEGRRDLVLFAVDGGAEALCLPLGALLGATPLVKSQRTELTCLAWHPRGWLAVGTRAGVVAHVWPSGHVIAYRGAKRAVEALAFTRDASALLIASRAPGIVRMPLVDEELAG